MPRRRYYPGAGIGVASPRHAAAQAAGVATGCGGEVNCENLCTRTLTCEVTFAPSDDLEGAKIVSGERTDEQSCALGCAENPAVTTESAQCVDEVTNASQDPVVCQRQVLDCFGAEVSEG